MGIPIVDAILSLCAVFADTVLSTGEVGFVVWFELACTSSLSFKCLQWEISRRCSGTRFFRSGYVVARLTPLTFPS
jgi:hypothetical protein